MSWASEKNEEIDAVAGDDLLRIIGKLLVQISCDLESIDDLLRHRD